MRKKCIALVAHDNKKKALVEWAEYNKTRLADFDIYATGTTAQLIEKEIDVKINRLQSGPLGGDQQIGALIAESKVDILVFFWDPLEPLPHDPDIKALLRLAVLWNIPLACNRTTADFIFASPLLTNDYEVVRPNFDSHLNRKI